MGILSLTSFVDENQQLLTDLKLHDTRVVIDGNNLYHFCYSYFNFHHQHGGDYDAFAEKIRYYFSAFKACNIEPFIVFDGAYDEDNRKLQTTVKRAKDRLYNACLISAGKRAVICPILTFETFVHVLDELKINHVTCDFEADSEIAALAQEWNCPVMSNDSDFFIYDVRGGFILFDYLSLVVKTLKDEEESYRYLDAQVYYVDNLLSYFPEMDRTCMTLFATLMGNDYVNAEDFATFFAHHSFPRPSSKRLRTSKRHERMISLLTWLETAGSLEDAIRSLLCHIKKENRPRIEKVVRTSVSAYLDLKNSLSLYFNSDKSTESMESKLQTKAKKSLPNWLVKEVRCSHVPITALNTFVHRRNVLLAQIELMTEESAYNSALPLRQIFYGILLSLDSSHSETIEEYTRLNKQLKKNSIETAVVLEDGSNIQRLLDIPQMTECSREQLLKKCLGGSAFSASCLDDSYSLAIHVIPYWIRHSVPKVNLLYLYALIVSFIKVSVLDKKHGSCVPNRDGSKTLKETCDAKIRSKARDNLEKLCQKESSHVFDVKCIHAYSQYQACLKAAIYLNSLLLQPIPQAHPGKLLNGTCFYCISKELSKRKCPKLYIDELLVRESKLAMFFNRVLAAVLEILPEDALVYAEEGKKNNKRKAKGTKGKRPTEKTVSDSSDEHVSDQEQNESVIAACALGNKFALLELAE